MKYLSLLRGINVSGQKKIKMADLKSLYQGLGFNDVETYIQSGNVIFESKGKTVAELSKRISAAIEAEYGFHVPVELRTARELSLIIEALPFEDIDIEQEGSRVLVSFLAAKPRQSDLEVLKQYVKLPEQLILRGREVYLYCPDGYGKSKLSNNFLENKLKVLATTRNWKSVCQLSKMLG